MREQLLSPLPAVHSCQGSHVDDTTTSSRVHLHFATPVQQQAAFVVRGDLPTSAWPRQYKAESLDISLHLSRSSSGNYMLLGILTSTKDTESADAFEGVDAELYPAPGPFGADGGKRAETPLLLTQVDDLGHIVFRDVPEGEYIMILRLPGLEVVIEELPIRSK